MAQNIILYYSVYGHIETMANVVSDGARSVEGAEVTIKRVPELIQEDVARKAGVKLDQSAAIATVDELPSYDAIILVCQHVVTICAFKCAIIWIRPAGCG